MTTTRTGSTSLTARVLRALSVFGSIELITMVCTVIRTKLVAIWIGAAGVGIISLYNSTMEMLRAMMQLNLRQSAVRQISAAPASSRAVEVSAARRCGIAIGLVSAIITAILAPLLSRLTFDSPDYTIGFLFLALTMAATAVTAARSAILQALGQLQALARASLRAALLSTVAAMVLFYYFRFDAIVPVLMVFPFSTLFFLLLERRGLPAKVKSPEVTPAMKAMMRLGGWLTVAASITLVADYVLRVYINNVASFDMLGYFQAGYTIVNSYIGIFFTAISMEFFPRLSATISRPVMTRTVVAHEISVISWLLLPMIIIFLSADSLILQLLYSRDFLVALPYLSIAIIATLPRGASWCLAYVIISKGDGRAYVITEALSAAVMLGAAIPLWHSLGLPGLGLAYLIQYILYTATTYFVYRRRYGLDLPFSVKWLVVITPVVAAVALALKVILGAWAPLLLLPAILPFTIKYLKR